MNTQQIEYFLRTNATRFLPIFIFLLACLLYGLHGFYGPLLKDQAIFLYGGQGMAQGIPPYVSIFDIRGPLGPMMTGWGVMLAEIMNWNDIITVRVIFFLISCLTVVSIYWLSLCLFNSLTIGFFSAIIFTAFDHFALVAASLGPQTKTPMVLFEVLAILFTIKKRWFWAGFWGTLAFLIWQPMAIFPFISFVLAITQPNKQQKAQATIQTILGIFLPLFFTIFYFIYKQALSELLDGMILFHLFYIERETNFSLMSHILHPLYSTVLEYKTTALPIYMGLTMVIYFYFWRRMYNKSWLLTLFRDPFAIIFLTFPILIIWSIIDFQAGPDVYVFLPYAAIGFGKILTSLVESLKNEIRIYPYFVKYILIIVLSTSIITISMANAFEDKRKHRQSLSHQLQRAYRIEEQMKIRFGNQLKVIGINYTPIFVHLRRINPNPYFLRAGISNYINANYPSGFKGWLNELQQYNPDVIFWQAPSETIEGKQINSLLNWLDTNYTQEQVETINFYIRKQ